MADLDQGVRILGFAAAQSGSFAEQAAEWSAFFSAAAQVSGGLVGLVFVALTFNGKLAGAGESGLRDLARQTFADFINVLVLSLALLVPHTQPENVCVVMTILGGFGIYRILRALLAIRRQRHAQTAARQLVQRFLLSMLGNAGLLAGGALLLQPQFNAQAFWSALFGSVLGLLVSGSRSAWLLVVPDPVDGGSD